MAKISRNLTGVIREDVRNQILEKAFSEKEAALLKKRHDFSMKVYNDIYPKKVRDQMSALPEGWLPETDHMFIQFGGSSSGYCRRNFENKVRVLAQHNNRSGAIKVYAVDDPLTHEHEDLHRADEDLKIEKNRAINQINGVLVSCGTTKSLKELWPEIADIVSKHEASATKTGTSVAPILKDLNKALGLKL